MKKPFLFLGFCMLLFTLTLIGCQTPADLQNLDQEDLQISQTEDTNEPEDNEPLVMDEDEETENNEPSGNETLESATEEEQDELTEEEEDTNIEEESAEKEEAESEPAVEEADTAETATVPENPTVAEEASSTETPLTTEQTTTAPAETPVAAPVTAPIAEEPAPAAAEPEAYVIKESTFLAQRNDIYANVRNYLGKTIKYEGIYMFCDVSTTGEDRRSVIRYGPACCDTDIFIGFELVYDKGYPKSNAWVEVIGVLSGYKDANGNNCLRITATSLKELPTRGKEKVE
ncbi:MAG: hypothetical protein FWG43_03705 [Clostridiales bacterium]|nr:hypothetical protein [Clostridiales bacterium]